jgi:hypothetical protein
MASVWATFSPKNHKQMTKEFVNTLLQKAKKKEERLLLKIINPAERLTQEDLHQMSDNILNYSAGRMTTIEKTLFEFKLRGDQQLNIKYKRYQASLRKS